MKIRYDIKVSIANKNTGTCSSFPAKTLEAEITAATDALLYDNHHIIAEDVYLFDIFKEEVETYSNALGVPVTELEFDSFEVIALAPPEQYQVYFDFDSNKQKQQLRPTIKVYIAPKESRLSKPTLTGAALDKNSILWQWDDDGYAHYLVIEAIDPDNPDDADKIIAQLPIGVHEYIETPLEPGTAYTRRLIAYTATQYSEVSSACTIWTETASPDVILSQYETPRLYDFTIDESEREVIEERMKAFHSGVGDFTDLKVYKQMDADFYQKFKAYFEITGRRVQREKRYEQVGFWYKVCLDAMERIDEQEGEVTFDIYAYPREWLRLEDYVWATEDVQVQAMFEATVFLQKKEEYVKDSPVTIYECKIEHHVDPQPAIPVPQPPSTHPVQIRYGRKSAIIISIDLSTSMFQDRPGKGNSRIDYVKSEAKKLIDYIAEQVSKDIDAYNTELQKAIDELPDGDSQKATLTAKKISDTDKAVMMQYIIIGWGGRASEPCNASPSAGHTHIHPSAFTYYNQCDATLAKQAIDGMTPSDCGHYTNFYAGLTKAASEASSARDVVCHLFFTDGFANVGKSDDRYSTFHPYGGQCPNGSKSCGYSGCAHAKDVIKSIEEGFAALNNKNVKTWVLFSVPLTTAYVDDFYKGSDVDSTAAQKAVDFANNDIVPACKSAVGSDHVKIVTNGLNSMSDGELFQHLKDGLEKLFELQTIDVTITKPDVMVPQPDVEWDEFKGWGPSPTKVDSVAMFDLDSMIAVKVTCGPYFYTFKNTASCTPVVYSRKEKRAVISKVLEADPNKNYYVDSSGKKVMILEEILKAVKETEEYKSGYDTIVKTSSGKAMIKGLFITDNYTVGDDDMTYTRDWCHGMEGSVNSFTQIDQGVSDSYGDDCYLVDSSSVLQIQGYTEAMIFEGEHAVSAELNAYDYPSVVAIHSNGSVVVDNNTDVPCNTFMFNREDKGKRYTGNGPYSHCIDIVECDRDIMTRGLDNLIDESTETRQRAYQVFDPLTHDIEAFIEKWYRSPVLNYRFNIEDPDAKTSIYEILPDCNPQDNFLHVVLLHIYYARNVYVTDGPNPEKLTGVPITGFNYFGPDLNTPAYNAATKHHPGYGDDPIAYYNDPNLLDNNPWGEETEGLYKWTQKMWQHPLNYDNGWYLDDFVWFVAEKMKKDLPYHDEIPSGAMQPMYGLVNGRYTAKSQDGKQNLLVQVPQFNIPTTVKDYYIHYGKRNNPINWNGDGTHPLKIYIVLTEFHPKDALVGYQWEKDCQWVNPETGKVNDDITQDYKGCYATFSSDSVTYKDIEYYDLIQTINFENQEVFDTKNNIIHYQLEKPVTEYTYTNYYLKVSTDNSDVLPLNYPGEIMFDSDGHADFGVTFKGVVNATTKWSPRIHNGYYYLNQHEYFAYSEFDFDHEKTNVEHIDTERCVTVFGHLTIDVTLCRKAGPPEIYRGDNAVTKNNRSSLLQNENQFQWVDGKGVTLKPSIDGEYYKQYTTYMYYSPIISFPNTLTAHGPISIDYFIDDGTRELMGVEIRSYILEDGKWSDWYPLAGVEVPCYPNTNYSIPPDIPLSHAYQVRFYLQASVKESSKTLEDYLCCYLDWKDDGEEFACYNVVTITDHITTGPYNSKGLYLSKIFDFGCDTTMWLDIFQSNYRDKIKLYAAGSFDRNSLYLENSAWQDISNGGSVSGRYIRYKIEIPEGEKLYWLHKKIYTKQTEAVLPYVCGFTMEGEYHPTDTITNFINIEAFEIPADGEYHNLENLSDLTKIIGDDVLDRGYTMNEIKKVDVRCTTKSVHVLYNSNLLNEYPGSALKTSQLRAKAPLQTTVDINYTPFIFLDDDDMGYDKITIYGATPQQYCPITVEDPYGQSYIQLHECTEFEQRMKIVCKEKTKYVELPTNRYDYLSMKVKVNDSFIDESQYKIVNHIIIFNNFLEIGDSVEVIYFIMYSFIAEIDRYGDETIKDNMVIYLYTGHELDENGEVQYIKAASKYKIFFETSLRNNKFTANKLSLNPIYRTDYKGFIYLTDDNNEPYTVKIYCNPRRIKAGGYDKVDVAVEVLDILGNPVINREVYLDCGAREDDANSFDRGVINCENNLTDMNGVVHFVYESSVLPVEATIRASVFNCAGASIEDSITIVNE